MRTLPVSLLHELLRYEPESGKLFWRERPVSMFARCRNPDHAATAWNAKLARREAGTPFRGYVSIAFKGFGSGPIFAHRVAWAMHYGAWPAGEIDHINGNRRDNRIENLRDVSHAENQRNLSLCAHNTSGITGVRWDVSRRRWRAFIQVKGQYVDLGRHACVGRAIGARRAAERQHGFHENHGKRTTA